MAVGDEPAWLTLFRQSADPKEVAKTWLDGLGPAEQQEAKDAATTARAKLRRAIVDSECPEVRADCAAGWKYTGTVLRAADDVLGIPPLKTRKPFQVPGGGLPFRPKHVCKDAGEPGSLGLWWSDLDTAVQAKRLREECGITHRLNVAIETIPKFSAEDDAFVKTVHVAMEDTFNPNEETCKEWPSQLAEALEILRGWRSEGVVANVNCQMGKNRSGAVILMWLCCECGWELEEAVTHLRTITPLACGNPHLLAAMTQVLGVPDVKVPLNPAADGGGWVCISPPGSPRAGSAEVFDSGISAGGMEEAAGRLAALGSSDAGATAGYFSGKPAEVEVPEEAEGDIGALFSELSDVD